MRHLLDDDCWGVNVYDKDTAKRTYFKFKPVSSPKYNNIVSIEYWKDDVTKEFKQVFGSIINIRTKTNERKQVLNIPTDIINTLEKQEINKINIAWHILCNMKAAIDADGIEYESINTNTDN